MYQVIKKKGKGIVAYQLGKPNQVIQKLMEEGKITQLDNGTYEIMTEEAFHGKSGKGEIAYDGDYIKISTTGFPYPNQQKFFLENHKHIKEDEYEQIPKVLDAWDMKEPMCEEIQFLIKHKGLIIDPSNVEQCFSAPIWGTKEVAAYDSVLIFYSMTRDENKNILDIDFNFITRSEFNQFYDVC